jgi:hypothetical protein
MPKKSLAELAITLAAKLHKLKEPLIVHRDETSDPKTGHPLHLFHLVDAGKGNEPAQPLILGHDGEPVKTKPELLKLFDRSGASTGDAVRPIPATGEKPIAAPITISPDTNVLTLNPGQTLDETITVTIPKNSVAAKADVYFLADTTGSMGGILAAVQAGANSILNSLNMLGVDLVYGVGNYKDFRSGDPYCFQHQLSPTNVAPSVTAAINTWTAAGGEDVPEGNLFALDSLAVPPGGTIGWRPGSKRIIVWFGDAAGHDPICTAVSGVAPITEASATGKLAAQGITVLAISTAKPGLDADPKNGAFGYTALCGAPGGLPGQGTRIATNTGGTFVTGINPGNIVNTITNLVTGAIAGINNVKLVPSASIAPFVISINPAAGYGPLAGDKEHTLKFEVKFTGIPCKPDVQVFNGTLDVVADGKVVAAKRVQITVPPCAGFVYSVKFVCGVQPAGDCGCGPVQPGHYATEINLHNYSLKEVTVRKRFVPVVLAGAPIGREPRVAGAKAEDKIVLPPQTATMDDCCRIAELIYGAVPSPMPLTIGFLELTTSAEIAVTAVYTASGSDANGVSISVEQVTGRRG